jgi:hypothetical protein
MERKLPFSVKKIESLFERRNGSLALNNFMKRTIVHVSKSELDSTTYGKIRGPLLELVKKLRAVTAVLQDDDKNYVEVLKMWMATFMHGIMSFGVNDMRPVVSDIGRYMEIFERYKSIFLEALVAEDVSEEENYEDHELTGDMVYKSALLYFFVRELKIRNKTVATVLKHTHENTKALSDLAKMFSMDKLVKTKKSKMLESVHEDVFESILGVLQDVQWEIQRDPKSPEFIEFSADNGFANRLVRMIFKNSDARREYRIAPKTFVTTLRGMFNVSGESIKSKKGSRVGDLKDGKLEGTIVFQMSEAIIGHMSQVFGCNSRALSEIFNCTYVSDDPDVNGKIFDAFVYNDVVDRLEEIGITQQKVQHIKNRSLAPPAFHEKMNKISVAAQLKGYWLGLNIPLSSKGVSSHSIQCTLYHNDPQRSLRKVTIDGYQKEQEWDAFENMFTQIEKIVESARPIDVKEVTKKKNRLGGGQSRSNGSRKINFKRLAPDTSIPTQRVVNPDATRMLGTGASITTNVAWKIDVAMSAIPTSGVAITGTPGMLANQAPQSGVPTIYDLFSEMMPKQPRTEVITEATLRDVVINPNLQKSFFDHVRKMSSVFSLLSSNTNDGGLCVVQFNCLDGVYINMSIMGVPPEWLLPLSRVIKVQFVPDMYPNIQPLTKNDLLMKIRDSFSKELSATGIKYRGLYS